MQVRMKVSMSGTRNGEDWPARGGVIDLPDAEASDLVSAGLAEVDDAEATSSDQSAEPEGDQPATVEGDQPAADAAKPARKRG